MLQEDRPTLSSADAQESWGDEMTHPTVLITGASRGLGAATARTTAQMRANGRAGLFPDGPGPLRTCCMQRILSLMER
jgi:hypothetical protein